MKHHAMKLSFFIFFGIAAAGAFAESVINSPVTIQPPENYCTMYNGKVFTEGASLFTNIFNQKKCPNNFCFPALYCSNAIQYGFTCIPNGPDNTITTHNLDLAIDNNDCISRTCTLTEGKSHIVVIKADPKCVNKQPDCQDVPSIGLKNITCVTNSILIQQSQP